MASSAAAPDPDQAHTDAQDEANGVWIRIPMNHKGKLEETMARLELQHQQQQQQSTDDNNTKKHGDDAPKIPTKVDLYVIDFEVEREQAMKRKKAAYKKRRRKRRQLDKQRKKQQKQWHGHAAENTMKDGHGTENNGNVAPPRKREIRSWDSIEEMKGSISNLFSRLGVLLPSLDTVRINLGSDVCRRNKNLPVTWEAVVCLLRNTTHSLKFLQLDLRWFERRQDIELLMSLGLPLLETFVLNSNCISDPLFFDFTPHLVKRCPHLECISLSLRFEEDGEDPGDVFEMLGSSLVLKNIKIKYETVWYSNELATTGFQTLLNAINANQHSKIEELRLDRDDHYQHDFADKSIQPLLTMLRTSKTLKKLCILVQREFMKEIFKALESNNTLTSLKLIFLSRSGEGAFRMPAIEALKKMVQVNTTLVDLVCGGCGVHPCVWSDAADHVKEHLQFNKAKKLLQSGDKWSALDTIKNHTSQTFRLLSNNPNLLREFVESTEKGHVEGPRAKKQKVSC